MKIIIPAVIAGFAVGYLYCDRGWKLEYEKFQNKSTKKYNDLLLTKMEAEKANRAKVHEVEANYLKELEKNKNEYEKHLADVRASFDSRVCEKSHSSSGGSKSGTAVDATDVICYSKSELLRKIEATLAIGHEADELVLKYKALHEIP